MLLNPALVGIGSSGRLIGTVSTDPGKKTNAVETYNKKFYDKKSRLS